MDVLAASSAVGSQVRHVVSQVNNARGEGRVEGNTPDGDGDRDDAVRAAPAGHTNAVGPLGGNINVNA